MKTRSLLFLVVAGLIGLLATPALADTLLVRLNPAEDGVTMAEVMRGYRVELTFNPAYLSSVEGLLSSAPKDGVGLALRLIGLARYGELSVRSPGPGRVELKRSLYRLSEDGSQEEVGILLTGLKIDPVLYQAFEGLRGLLQTPPGVVPLFFADCSNDGTDVPCGECQGGFHSQENWEDPCLSGGAGCTICCVCAKPIPAPNVGGRRP